MKTARVIAITTAIIWAMSGSAEECIQISAEITQTNHVQLGAAPPYWTFPVTCSVWSNRWRIDSGLDKNGLESAYYDGTNVYRSLAPLNNGQKSKANSEGNTVTIMPSPGGHPLANLSLNIPWLAFCSGRYLKLPDRFIPLPNVDVPGRADSLSLVDKTTSFDETEGLPKTVELLTSKERYLNSLDDQRLFRTSQLLHARLTRSFNVADGLVRFRYTVEAFTNFNGRSFPTLFRYFDYRALNNSSDPSLIAEGVGRVTSVRQASPPGNVFTTNAAQSVIDVRLRQRDRILDAIIYAWAKAEVPPTDNPTVQQKLKEALSRAPTVEHAERIQ